VGRELGVRYVLEGSVRKAGNRVRITGQLIDVTTGTHLWADRFEGTLGDIFELQDQVATSVVGAIAPQLERAEIERAKRKPTESLDAYDYYLRAQPHLVTGSAGDITSALDFLQKAAALDPAYALAHAGIAWCRLLQLLGGSEQPTPEFLRAAATVARRAVEIDPHDPDVLSAAAIVVCLMGRDYAAGTEWSDISTRLNPNSSLGWGRAGYIKCWVSEFRAGIECFNRAMRLSPFDPMTYVFQSGLGMANMFLGDWPAAIAWLRRSLSNNRHFAPTYRFLAVSLVGSGQLEEARRVIAELTTFDPLSSMRRAQMTGFRDEAPKRLYIDSLRRAGLPE